MNHKPYTKLISVSFPSAKVNDAMPEDQDLDNRSRNYRIRRSIMDYGMGLVIGFVGIFLFLAPHFGVSFDLDNLFRYMFAGLCILYGAFRIYRGYKKNYFN